MSSECQLLLLCGPPGCGKTTVARRLCSIWLEDNDGEAIHVELDDIRNMVVAEANLPGHSTDIWLPIACATIERAKALSGLLVVEGLFIQDEVITRIRNISSDATLIELSAPYDICLDRNMNRESVGERLSKQELESLFEHDRQGEWQVVDSGRTLDQVCQNIRSLAGV